MKVLIVFGTRPEAIKMVPVIKAFESNPKFDLKVCITSQHKKMLRQVLNLFDIEPDFDLSIMKSGQSLEEISSKILLKLEGVLSTYKPDLVLVHGDTTTTFITTLASFYKKIRVGHIEAGLRTKNLFSPWPEEANRKLTSVLSSFHFAPTSLAKKNLLEEGVPQENIVVTGNTVIDSLLWMEKKIFSEEITIKKLDKKFNFLDKTKKLILVTGHRRENFGEGFKNICNALKKIATRNSDVQIIYPVHLNPNVKKIVNHYLKEYKKNIFLINPQDYSSFFYLMKNSYLVLTDSGGIQEEAPSLGKPVLLMRDTSERPEAVKAGTVKLVGTDVSSIVSNVEKLLNNNRLYNMMSSASNPYGNGTASKKIISFLSDKL